MKFIPLLIVYLLSSSIYAGGPWLNKKKSGFFHIQSTFPGGAYSSLLLENGGDDYLVKM